MCGIVGMAGKLSYGHRQVFKDMLAVCQVRGRDSTGVIRVKPDDDYVWVKNVGTPEYLLDTKMYDKQIDTGDSKILIGHCRAKTVGEVSAKNAHPFDFPGKVCGVHNGTLKGTWKMDRNRDFVVDSELLYWHIADRGIEHTITKDVDPDGAWALVYWNAENNTLNFLRNDQRPLWFTHSEDKQVMFWASEPWMLSTISRKMKLWDGDGKDVIYALPLNTLLTFSVDYSKHKANEIFTMSSPKEIKAEARSNVGNFRGNHGWNGGHSVISSSLGGEVADPFAKKDELNDSIIDLTGRPLRSADNEGKVLRLPLPERMHSAGVSTPTATTGATSSTSSSNVSGTSTGSTNSTSSRKEKLSLLQANSRTSQQEHNEKHSKGCSVHSPNSGSPYKPAKLCSTRRVAGQLYITDNKTSREFEERRFDEETGGYCGFCRNPIGDLSEVHEIFNTQMLHDDELWFVCTSCVVPAVA